MGKRNRYVDDQNDDFENKYKVIKGEILRRDERDLLGATEFIRRKTLRRKERDKRIDKEKKSDDFEETIISKKIRQEFIEKEIEEGDLKRIFIEKNLGRGVLTDKDSEELIERSLLNDLQKLEEEEEPPEEYIAEAIQRENEKKNINMKDEESEEETENKLVVSEKKIYEERNDDFEEINPDTNENEERSNLFDYERIYYGGPPTKEIKNSYISANFIVPTNNFHTVNIINIFEGDTSSERVGRKVRILDIEIKLKIDVFGQNKAENVRSRIMFLYDKQSNKQSLNLLEAFTPRTINVYESMSATGRFRFDEIYDDMFEHKYIGNTGEYKATKDTTDYEINGKFVATNFNVDLQTTTPNISINGGMTPPANTIITLLATNAPAPNAQVGTIRDRNNNANTFDLEADNLKIDTPVYNIDPATKAFINKGLSYTDIWEIDKEVLFGPSNIGSALNIIKGNMAISVICDSGSSTSQLACEVKLKINFLN